MEHIREAILEVWREVGKQLELTRSATAITCLLSKHVPLEYLLVRRFDDDRRVIETVVVASPSRNLRSDIESTSILNDTQYKAVLQWAQGTCFRATDLSPQLFGILVPQELGTNVLIGPLKAAEKLAGMLLITGPSMDQFYEEQLLVFDALLEPFSAALANNKCLHDLATLREAAEADRRSLLTRLGRQELSEEIVGADSGLKQVMERVSLVSRSDAPVLILGETGTGKEVVARSIHNRSLRSAGPFIRINCGAIPSELIDSQLFGHEKGSFTGASEARQGWFERADGGTLFLDEIGELSLAAQIRLLRVLQEHQIERVGGQDTIHVDVRIVAATHRDLSAMVKNGTFREDLWYRIHVFPILLPRLCDRTEDIPALANYFARRASTRFGLPLVGPTAADLRMLVEYSWPGNIRELGAVIDRAAILGNGQSLEVATSLGLNQPYAAPATDEPTFYEVIPESVPLNAMNPKSAAEIAKLDDAIRRQIERALTVARGKIEGPGGTAELLAINPHTLRARMRKLGIDWSKFRDS